MNHQRASSSFLRLFFILSCLVVSASPALAELIATLPEVMNPFYFTIADGRMYIVEDSSVAHIYKIGERGVSFVKTIGRVGQGPGEFDFMYAVRPRKDFLEATAINKMVRFTLEGEYVDEIKILVPMFKGGVDRIGGNFLVRYVSFDAAGTTQTVRLYDGNFKLIKEIANKKDLSGFPKINLVTEYLSFRVVGDQVFIVDSGNETSVTIFDADGRLIRKVILPLAPFKMTAALREAVIKPIKDNNDTRMPWSEYEKMLVFPDQAPGLDSFEVSDGKFFARTYRYDGDQVEFVLMDMGGKVLKRMFLPFTGRLSNGIHFCLHQGKYFYLKFNNAGDGWELHAIKVY